MAGYVTKNHMQIACKKFGCQKAVEVCYWTCKFRPKCKDWQGALQGQPGTVAITERLAAAAAKTGRSFDVNTLIKPVRIKRKAAKPVLLTPVIPVPVKIELKNKKLAPVLTAPKKVKVEMKPVLKTAPEAEKTAPENTTENTTGAKTSAPKPASKAARPKAPQNGPVYLLLNKNGKYKELREADLLKEAANIMANPSVRLVKGQFLVPHITFKPQDE